MSNRFWNTDKIVSLSAVLISIMTLVVLVYQTNLMREQQRLSVMPHLMYGKGGTGTSSMKVLLWNQGIGPAFIESINIVYDNKDYPTDLVDFLYNQIHAMDTLPNVLSTNLYPGMLIPAGEEVPILQVQNSSSTSKKLADLFLRLEAKGFDLEIVYKSIYNESWQIKDSHPIPVELP